MHEIKINLDSSIKCVLSVCLLGVRIDRIIVFLFYKLWVRDFNRLANISNEPNIPYLIRDDDFTVSVMVKILGFSWLVEYQNHKIHLRLLSPLLHSLPAILTQEVFFGAKLNRL